MNIADFYETSAVPLLMKFKVHYLVNIIWGSLFMHCDVFHSNPTPQNILVVFNGADIIALWIIDWGNSKLVQPGAEQTFQNALRDLIQRNAGNDEAFEFSHDGFVRTLPNARNLWSTRTHLAEFPGEADGAPALSPVLSADGFALANAFLRARNMLVEHTETLHAQAKSMGVPQVLSETLFSDAWWPDIALHDYRSTVRNVHKFLRTLEVWLEQQPGIVAQVPSQLGQPDRSSSHLHHGQIYSVAASAVLFGVHTAWTCTGHRR